MIPQGSTLADFTAPELLLMQLQGRDVTEVITELGEALRRAGRVQDLLSFNQAVLQREALASTEFEAGLALPHGRDPHLRELSFAFGRSATPIPWRPGASPTVRLVFLMAVPADDPGNYLSLVASLSRMLRNTEMMEELRETQDPARILEIFRGMACRGCAVRKH